MLNIQGLMKQAQMMQKKMQETQARLSQEEREGTSAGGLVKVTLNGKSEMKKISIDKSLVVADETDVLDGVLNIGYKNVDEQIAKLIKAI